MIYDSEMDAEYKSRFFIIKDYDSSITVLSLYTRKGYIHLPDVNWYRWGPKCHDFGPELIDGKLKPDGMILCKDKTDVQKWQPGEMRWDYKGINLGKYTDDIPTEKFKIKGHFLYLRQS